MKPALHVIGLPHTQTTKEYLSCAYTQKHLNFCNMMKSLGYKVYSYASEENEANVDELITIYPKSDQQKWFGSNDFSKKFFNITWNPNDEHWQVGNSRAITEIFKRINPGDIICIIAGVCQKQIADFYSSRPVVEYGIGYTGVFSQFKVFESYSHMHWVYGAMNTDNGVFYDAVIPNYFDLADFDLEKDTTTVYDGNYIKVVDDPEYYVFLGRFILRKGVEIAIEVTRRLGKQLILAGQGVDKQLISPDGTVTLIGEDGTQFSGKHIRHIGSVNAQDRLKLLKGATASFIPTTYIEPFGGVSIESMMCGTPVITTDFGAFAENNIQGLSGYRFRTIGEATQGAEAAAALDRTKIAKYARDNFSTDVVRHKYDAYFMQIQDLYNGGGFYSDWAGDLKRYGKSI